MHRSGDDCHRHHASNRNHTADVKQQERPPKQLRMRPVEQRHIADHEQKANLRWPEQRIRHAEFSDRVRRQVRLGRQDEKSN